MALQFKDEDEMRKWLKETKAAGAQPKTQRVSLNEVLDEPSDPPAEENPLIHQINVLLDGIEKQRPDEKQTIEHVRELVANGHAEQAFEIIQNELAYRYVEVEEDDPDDKRPTFHKERVQVPGEYVSKTIRKVVTTLGIMIPPMIFVGYAHNANAIVDRYDALGTLAVCVLIALASAIPAILLGALAELIFGFLDKDPYWVTETKPGPPPGWTPRKIKVKKKVPIDFVPQPEIIEVPVPVQQPAPSAADIAREVEKQRSASMKKAIDDNWGYAALAAFAANKMFSDR